MSVLIHSDGNISSELNVFSNSLDIYERRLVSKYLDYGNMHKERNRHGEEVSGDTHHVLHVLGLDRVQFEFEPFKCQLVPDSEPRA